MLAGSDLQLCEASLSGAYHLIEAAFVDLRLGSHGEDHEGSRLYTPVDGPPSAAAGTGAQLAQPCPILALDRAAVRSAELRADSFELLACVLNRGALARVRDRCTLNVGRRVPQHFVWRPNVGGSPARAGLRGAWRRITPTPLFTGAHCVDIPGARDDHAPRGGYEATGCEWRLRPPGSPTGALWSALHSIAYLLIWASGHSSKLLYSQPPPAA
jgi:hypothetical protein